MNACKSLKARAGKKAHNIFPLNQVVSHCGVTYTCGQSIKIKGQKYFGANYASKHSARGGARTGTHIFDDKDNEAVHKSNPNGGDQSKVQQAACGLLPFTCSAAHYGSPPYFLSPPWLTTASPFTTVHVLLHNMNISGMPITRALGTSTVTKSIQQPPAATSRTPTMRAITSLTCNGALREDVHGRSGLHAHRPTNTSVQCVRIFSQSNPRLRWQTTGAEVHADIPFLIRIQVITNCPPEPNLYRVVIFCCGSMTAQRIEAVMGTQYHQRTPVLSGAMFHMWVFMDKLETKLV